MRIKTAQLWLGVWLLLIPFLGVPGVWKERLLLLTGLCVVVFALVSYYRCDKSAPRSEERRGGEQTPAAPAVGQ